LSTSHRASSPCNQPINAWLISWGFPNPIYFISGCSAIATTLTALVAPPPCASVIADQGAKKRKRWRVIELLNRR
jgi:hypothetical protein